MMSTTQLWDLLHDLQGSDYKIVDLTHELSPVTPHWYGFDPLKADLLFDYNQDTPSEKLAPMRVYNVTVATQYGTHVDAPRHFHQNDRSLADFTPSELMFPLVVIDKHEECAENPEFTLSIDDIKVWEAEHGKIPKGSFVAFRSDWYKKTDLDNKDADGQPHYPGWALETIQYLVEERQIGAIGHEPADTDPSTITTREDEYPYPGEQYILSTNRFQIEVMKNLDQLPATGAVLLVAFPKMKDGVGYPARVAAIAPQEN